MDAMKVGSPITENDGFVPRSNLVVMLCIGIRAANYIKLVSQGCGVSFATLFVVSSFHEGVGGVVSEALLFTREAQFPMSYFRR